MADFYGNATKMVIESKAILQGLQACYEKGMYRFDVEADSQVLINIIREPKG